MRRLRNEPSNARWERRLPAGYVFSVAELARSQTPTRNPEGCQTVAGGRSVAPPEKAENKFAPWKGARGRDHVRKATNFLRAALKLVDPNFSSLSSPQSEKMALPSCLFSGSSAQFSWPAALSGTFPGCDSFYRFSGGLRCAPTPVLPGNPPGWAGRSATRQVRTLSTYEACPTSALERVR